MKEKFEMPEVEIIMFEEGGICDGNLIFTMSGNGGSGSIMGDCYNGTYSWFQNPDGTFTVNVYANHVPLNCQYGGAIPGSASVSIVNMGGIQIAHDNLQSKYNDISIINRTYIVNELPQYVRVTD